MRIKTELETQILETKIGSPLIEDEEEPTSKSNIGNSNNVRKWRKKLKLKKVK